MIRTVKDSTWREVPLIAPSDVKALGESRWVAVRDSVHNGGFPVGVDAGKQDGWLVWLVSKSDKIDSAELFFVIYRRSLEFSADNTAGVVVKPPKTNSKVLGGVYMCPDFSHIGQIRFVLSGLAIPQEDSYVVLRCMESLPDALEDKAGNGESPELTPTE